MKKRREIKSWENRWEGRALTHTNIHIKQWWHEWVSKVLCSSIYKVVRKEIYNLQVKTHFPQNMSKMIMIEWGEELGNIKSKGTSWQILDLPHTNKMSQCYACISCGLGLEISKLALMNEVVGDHLELEPLANDFFDQLAQGVKQNDWSKRFGHIIWYFVRLRDNNSSQNFKVGWPIT